VSANTQNYSVFFCGLSKNCVDTISNNLNFLTSFFKESEFESYAIFVDSDSKDGTKEHLTYFDQNNNNVIYKNFDNLENVYKNRIERIQHSRNKCIDIVSKFDDKKNIVYIPLDLDLDLFKYTSVKEFDELIKYCLSKDVANGIFPFSSPFYYDIFALRATNWVDINSQYWVTKLKKYVKLGSFIFNYFLIFRHQINIEHFETKNIKVRSAFGGIGIYKVINKIPKYSLSLKNPETVSEHIKFNFQFSELEILKNWIVPAPAEHLEYRLLNFKEKIKYFFKTIFFDFVNQKK
tara:strand:- start:5905 stop:6780 length:876 start_codon:yes stop_codon:yes gene_type:complete